MSMIREILDERQRVNAFVLIHDLQEKVNRLETELQDAVILNAELQAHLYGQMQKGENYEH